MTPEQENPREFTNKKKGALNNIIEQINKMRKLKNHTRTTYM